MKVLSRHRRMICLLSAMVLFVLSFTACSGKTTEIVTESPVTEADTSRYLVAVEDEPDTADFQRTTIHYTIAQNVFDRLVEMADDGTGNTAVMPSLAESWEVSGNGCVYTFRLREGVKFSNGAELTASDVEYTLTRLLTRPDTNNKEIAEMILGAEELESGAADRLEGFEIIDELNFVITLEQPFEEFLACMSMPGASIMDEASASEAGDRFGIEPEWTIGTGSFILKSWEAGKGMILTANKDCWKGAPKCEGLDLRFIDDAEEVRTMFDNGELDVLDLDEVGDAAEYYIHGDIYQDRLYQVPRIGITYIALNESIEPLNDVRVRKALQLGLNRETLLEAVYSGHGSVENGIFPHGLYGFNPDLPEIPYDVAQAKSLLAEAGYEDGFDMTYTVRSVATQWELTLAKLIVDMWANIGVRAEISVIDENEFMTQRKSGKIACYCATWTADFDDPDNFIYTFFGTEENTVGRSLCYGDEEVMERVRLARAITDPDARLHEYWALEEKIIQEDAAWVPLFSRLRFYVTSERASGITSSWNGSVKNEYRTITISDTAK